jgi:hypothetical protein
MSQQRRRFKTFEERLSQEAEQFRQAAEEAQPGWPAICF